MADKTTVIQKRNIVVLGKTGSGKSTIANKVSGTTSFKVSSSIESVTRKASHTEVEVLSGHVKYNFKIVDTVGLFDTHVKNSSVMQDVKLYFRDKVPEGVNLVLFVFKNGRYSPEEKETFEYLIENFRDDISQISALIITGCEDLDDTGRKNLVEEFKTNAITAPVAKFMGKGIYPVGFPDTTNMKEKVRQVYEADMVGDIEKVRTLVIESGEMRLGKEIFDDGFWKRCSIL